MNDLAKVFRNNAANRDFFSGDFNGVGNRLENFVKPLDKVAAAIGHARVLSKVFFYTIVDATL